MPEYQYQAKQGPEKLIEGTIEASTEAAAIEKISQQGYVPVRISLYEKNTRQPVLSRNRSRRPNRMRMFLFSSHLARLIKSGVPILKSIQLLASQEKDPGIRSILLSLEHDVREGKTLSRAAEMFPSMFSPMYVSVVRAGEMSGGLHTALLRMATYFKKQEELTSKIRRAMAYPMVLALAGILSIVFIITFLVPKLEKMFSGIGQELPMPTRLILKLGAFMHSYWIFVFCLTAVLVFVMPRVLEKTLGKNYLDFLKLKTPLLGDLIIKIQFARFSRILELCCSNGLLFLQALRVAIPAVENTVIRKALEDCCKSVEKGASFGQALKKYSIFPDLTVSLISVGEQSGRVEETLVEIADVYEQEADEMLLYSTTILEPLMILFVGGIIGFIVMAVLLPIFEMNAIF